LPVFSFWRSLVLCMWTGDQCYFRLFVMSISAHPQTYLWVSQISPSSTHEYCWIEISSDKICSIRSLTPYSWRAPICQRFARWGSRNRPVQEHMEEFHVGKFRSLWLRGRLPIYPISMPLFFRGSKNIRWLAFGFSSSYPSIYQSNGVGIINAFVSIEWIVWVVPSDDTFHWELYVWSFEIEQVMTII